MKVAFLDSGVAIEGLRDGDSVSISQTVTWGDRAITQSVYVSPEMVEEDDSPTWPKR